MQFLSPHDLGEHQVKVRLVDDAQKMVVVRIHQGQGFSAMGAGENAQGFRQVHVRGEGGHVVAQTVQNSQLMYARSADA